MQSGTGGKKMKCVFFDIDGTLIDHKASEKDALKKFMLGNWDVFGSDFEFLYVMWEKLTREYRIIYEKGFLTFDDHRIKRMVALFAVYGFVITNEEAKEKLLEYQAYYEKSVRLYPDVLECLKELKGVKLGVISNGKTWPQVEKLEKTDILRYFSVFAVADLAGFAKPDRRIFEYACSQAGCKPSEAYYVGDRLDMDALAGEAAGFKTFWLNRSGRFHFIAGGVKEINGLNKLNLKEPEGGAVVKGAQCRREDMSLV